MTDVLYSYIFGMGILCWGIHPQLFDVCCNCPVIVFNIGFYCAFLPDHSLLSELLIFHLDSLGASYI